ncbi:MAG: HNH endonuclease signature motif containing protein [Veillonellales bacterium]
MPQRSSKPCRKIGCPNLTTDKSGYCDEHKNYYEQQRGSSNQRGYNSRWQKYRVSFLRSHPLCAECERQGKLTPATVVDHIKPHKGNMRLFWDPSNHQSLCKQCHDTKTAKEDGRWG